MQELTNLLTSWTWNAPGPKLSSAFIESIISTVQLVPISDPFTFPSMTFKNTKTAFGLGAWC